MSQKDQQQPDTQPSGAPVEDLARKAADEIDIKPTGERTCERY
jgi:hypothetical protein